MPLTRAEARRIALSLPGATEGPHYGKPAIFVDGEFVTRVHDKEEAVVILTSSIEMRDMMLEAEPSLFYITDHYRKWATLLARLSALDAKTLRALLRPRLAAIDTSAGTRARRGKSKKPAIRKISTKKKKKAPRR